MVCMMANLEIEPLLLAGMKLSDHQITIVEANHNLIQHQPRHAQQCIAYASSEVHVKHIPQG